MGLCLQCILLGDLARKITLKVHVIYLVFADGFNWPKIIARHNCDNTKHFGSQCDGRNKVCRCQYGTMRSIVRLIVMGRLCELCG
jgi:hypothetical protein